MPKMGEKFQKKSGLVDKSTSRQIVVFDGSINMKSDIGHESYN